MQLVSVVIPIYKLSLDENETKSFNQCLRILGKYPVSLVCSNTLNVSFYEELAERSNKNVQINRFSDKYFDSINGYNKLMLSKEFYQRFSEFDYILIYQLDAWVFRDELEYWCRQGYDYIGAPWFEGWHKAQIDSPLFGVGNGGFSLRHIKNHIKLLNEMERSIKFSKFLKRLRIIKLFNIIGVFKKWVWSLNTIEPKNNENEDYHFFILARIFKWFKIAPSEIALCFSIDANPQSAYLMNNMKLPFGCHAWNKYEKDFWSQFIK